MTCAVFVSFAFLLSKISMFVFSKVKQINKAEEVLSSKAVQNPCSEKRKALKRKRNPTAIKEDNSEEYSVPEAKRCCERRKKETLDACKVIHGGDSMNKQPVLDGIWLTLIKDSKPNRLKNYLANSKKIVKRVIPKIVKKSIETFEHSMENKIRSVKVLYSSGLISKEKYKSIRLNLTTSIGTANKKRLSLKFMEGTRLPKILPYDKLVQFIKAVDIGDVKDIKSDFCHDLDDDDQVSGSYRVLENFLLELADMYVAIDQSDPFLMHFGSEKYHFRVAVGADGAPFGKDDEATAWLISFTNVGQQITSEKENFIIAGANCGESHISMIRFAKKLVADISHIEKQQYVLPKSKANAKFSFDLVPSDMKWASTFSGELPNSAHYFSPFGNVSDDDKSSLGTLGTSASCMWKPWLYEGRLKTAAKVETKRRELEQTNLAASTKRNKLLNYIRDLKSRQEYPPILGPLIDNIYAEPLHNGNNAWQQLHAHILTHSNGKSSIPSSCTDLLEFPECALALHLATLKTIGATRLYKKVKKWCAQGRKGNLSYCFTGKETKIMCHKFMHLLQAISFPNDTPVQQLQICSFAFIGLQLRDAISRFSRVSVTQGEVQELSESCRKYFTASSLLLDSVTPTVWTIGHAIPFHTAILYNKFGIGLGINSMQGREAKQIRVSQYSKHATLSTRWQHVLRHDYMTTVWLRKQDPSSFSYHQSNDVYVPREVGEPLYCYCGFMKNSEEEKCSICSAELYKGIERSVAAGKLDQYICNLLSVIC